MEFMPFSDIDNAALSTLFPGNPKEYERAHDHDGNELTYYKGHWYISNPKDQDEAQLNEALHFGYETYDQAGPPAPLFPLDYQDPDADDIYDLDYANY